MAETPSPLLQSAILWLPGLVHLQLLEITMCRSNVPISYVLRGFQDRGKLFSKHHPAIMTRLPLIITLACL